MDENTVIIGTAPDSWGVWFPDDPRQTPWQRFLDEAAAAGYSWIELGPYGYLPTDPSRLADELAQRGLRLSAGTVFTAFHRGGGQKGAAEDAVRHVAELTAAMGGQHLVVIPAMWRDDVSGEALENPELSAEQWTDLLSGHNRLGRILAEDYGLRQQFHAHADSHICFQPDIERFLEGTDPALVSLCLDTGHAEYGGADSEELISKYPERIGYLHLKQIDPGVLATVRQQNLTWAAANTAGVMTEPPHGLPDLSRVITAAETLGKPLFGIVEQDMYPVADFGVPLPIARRTRDYLRSCTSRTRISSPDS